MLIRTPGAETEAFSPPTHAVKVHGHRLQYIFNISSPIKTQNQQLGNQVPSKKFPNLQANVLQMGSKC